MFLIINKESADSENMFVISIKDSKGTHLENKSCKAPDCTIGRSAKNLIRIKGWRIAGAHAELRQKEDGVHIYDTSSGIGTLVNGDSITVYGPLRQNDEITIGGYRLSVIDSDSSKTEATADNAETEHATPPQKEMHQTPVEESLPTSQAPRHHETDDHSASYRQQRLTWHKRIHEQLMNAMDLRRTDVESMNDAQLTETIKVLIQKIIVANEQDLPKELDQERLATEVLNEAVGLGPLEDLLADNSITEIMVNNFDEIYYEQNGKLHKSDITFSNNNAVLSVIERIVSPLGRRIDESSPMVDGRLQDGSRVNAIIPPLAFKGPCLTIRKFSKKRLTTQMLIEYRSISEGIVDFLKVAVKNRKNIIISGGTGSGKTTFLNVLSSFIPHDERIVTVEDSAELRMNQPHVVSLEGRPPNMEGKGAIDIRDLVKNCLRMRPDRIVVGECRGGEALDMLQAMNTGHDGSLTTVHANSPRDLVSRLGVMVMMAGMELPEKAILEQIASAVDIIVQQSRFSDGTRKITHVTEITGIESGVVQMQDIFTFKQTGLDEEKKVVGSFTATGRVPEFYEDLKQWGLSVDMSIFK